LAGAAILAIGLAACLQASPPAEAAAAAATAPPTPTPDGRPLQLVFADEFNTFRPWSRGQGVWRTHLRDGKDVFSKTQDDDFHLRTLQWNAEQQLYVDPDMVGHAGKHGNEEPPGQRAGQRRLGLNPFRVRNGALEIVADKAPANLADQLGGFQYTSGVITSQPSHSQTYGYFEMRAKLPRGKGIWPAFWLLPLDLSWPPEIDVMESIGDPSEVYVTVHSKITKPPNKKINVTPDDFHVYAVAWDPQDIVWFIDGKEVHRVPTPLDMNKPMYMLANVAVGGHWPGSPDASTRFPQVMSIDYIRAYRFAR
jgi:hypothetical protein